MMQETKTQTFIIHGWTYSTEKWQALVDILRAHKITPIMLQVPGLTETSSEIWDLEKYLVWLEGKTRDQQPFILIGHSNGGRISLAFAARYPERISQLILIDSAGVYHNELPIRLKRATFSRLARLGKAITSSPQLRRLLYKAARAQDYHDALPNMRATMANLQAADKTLPIQHVTTPTTIIWGEDDQVTPLSDAQLLARTIPDAQLYVIPGAKHSPFFTHPTEVADIIKEVITS